MGMILALLVLMAIVGLIVTGISRTVGASKHGKAAAQYAPLSLAHLQMQAPVWKIEARLTSKTIFGNDTTAWFESLLEKTYAAPGDLTGSYIYLRDSYARYLQALATFLRDLLPTAWNDDPAATATFVLEQKDAWAVVATEQTVEWLKQMALRQNELAAWRGAPDRWDAGLLAARHTNIAPPAPLAYSKYHVEVRCTPAALDAEVRRICGGGNAPALALATMAATFAPPPIPPRVASPEVVAQLRIYNRIVLRRFTIWIFGVLAAFIFLMAIAVASDPKSSAEFWNVGIYRVPIFLALFGGLAFLQLHRTRKLERKLAEYVAREGNFYRCVCGREKKQYFWPHFTLTWLVPWGLIVWFFKVKRCRDCGRDFLDSGEAHYGAGPAEGLRSRAA